MAWLPQTNEFTPAPSSWTIGNNMPSGSTWLTGDFPNTPVPAGGFDIASKASTPDVGALKMGGAITSIFGSINAAVGSYYAAESAKYQLKSQAQNLKFQSEMAMINAAASEYQAERIMEAGMQQAAVVGLKAGQTKSAAKASMAARGLQLGEGSAKEVIATTDLMKERDMLTINANTVRAANAARTQSVNYLNQSLMAGTSAQNMQTTAGAVSSFLPAYTSLMGGATTLANSWYRDRQFADMYEALKAARG